jgi:hypothetical protein
VFGAFCFLKRSRYDRYVPVCGLLVAYLPMLLLLNVLWIRSVVYRSTVAHADSSLSCSNRMKKNESSSSNRWRDLRTQDLSQDCKARVTREYEVPEVTTHSDWPLMLV